jgi:uncharacterized protein (DUF697 family)
MTPAQQDISTKSADAPETSRRRFFAKAATAAAAVPLAGAPMIAVAQAPIVFKMQGSWGTNEIFSEMAQQYVTRVNEIRSLCADLRANLQSEQSLQVQLASALIQAQ